MIMIFVVSLSLSLSPLVFISHDVSSTESVNLGRNFWAKQWRRVSLKSGEAPSTFRT